jgi:hypothetical protein
VIGWGLPVEGINEASFFPTHRGVRSVSTIAISLKGHSAIGLSSMTS